MERRIFVHMGPHKTGSTAIQSFLSRNERTLSEKYGVAIYLGNDLAKISNSLQRTDWVSAQIELLELRKKILERPEKNALLSSEDLSGNLPGRSATRRVYPRLSEHVSLIEKTFPEFSCKFFFFLRTEERWINSVYSQNLRFRQNFDSRDKFDKFLRFEGGWKTVLQKVLLKHGSQFIVVPYLDEAGFSSETALFSSIELDLSAEVSRWNAGRLNTSPGKKTIKVFEAINSSHASNQAKKDAKNWLLNPNDCTTQESGAKSYPHWPPSVSDANIARPLAPLAERARTRVYTQSDQPWLLPDPTVDFATIREELVLGSDEFPGGNRQDMRQQKEILRYRFRGQPELCFVVGFSISYLRRDTPHTESARKLFFRAWQTEYPLLLATLPTRWLISTLQTFMDHGSNDDERMIGTAGYFFANTLKAYEAERSLEGLPPDSKYPNKKPKTRNGFPGMDRFDLGGTDLMVNTLALLLELSTKDPVSGRVLQELLVRTRRASTIFSRMDDSRIFHCVSNPQFENCWSFFEKPRD